MPFPPSDRAKPGSAGSIGFNFRNSQIGSILAVILSRRNNKNHTGLLRSCSSFQLTCPLLSEIILQVLRNIPIALIAALAGFIQIEARAQTSTFEITFSNFAEGGTTAGSGLVSGSLISPGVYEIVSGSFTFTSSDGLNGGTYSLVPNPNPPNPSHSPAGDLLFDNLVSPAADPIVSNNGLLFGSGSVEINLYSNAGHTPEYQLFENNGVSIGGDATIVAAPEPSPLMLILPFGAALWFLRLKRAI